MIDIIPYEAGHMLSLLKSGVIECGVSDSGGEFLRNLALSRETCRSNTGLLDGELAACYGVEKLWPGVAEFWAFFSPSVELKSIEVSRKIAEEIDRLSHGYHRVQAHVRKDFVQAVRMMEWLGFDKECLCTQFAQDKCDCYQFVRIS